MGNSKPYHDKGRVIIKHDRCQLSAVPPIPTILELLNHLIKGQQGIEKKRLDEYNSSQRQSARMLATCRKKREAKV
jgi:hypothetical protein|tara:strand:+ start:1204 stop:1431 length:228 start_codon:yes stop_codon:yes gene_type:complete